MYIQIEIITILPNELNVSSSKGVVELSRLDESISIHIEFDEPDCLFIAN